MKYKSVIILIFCTILFSSCTEELFRETVPESVAFVHDDGTPISPNDCINPNGNYAILITATSIGDGSFQPTAIEYSLNGVPYVVTFIKDEDRITPIKLRDGFNKVEIVGTAFTKSLYFDSHTTFELVE